MTESTTEQPAATNFEEAKAVEQNPTLEQLNESIKKLEANRNEILTEKRAESSAKKALQSQLDSALQATEEANNKLDALMLKHGREKLTYLISPVKGSEEFINHKIEGLITLENGDISYKNAQGKSVTAKELANEIRDNEDLAPFVRAFPAGTKPPTTGGGLCSSGIYVSSASRSTKTTNKLNSGQFGLK